MIVDATPENSKQIEQALSRVLSSPEFTNAARLKDFLSYVVRETCCGRGGLVLGKTIAQDVYGRSADSDGRGLSLVKVDAGRLRRRLGKYYAGTGVDDSLHIIINRGGYRPSFEYSKPEISPEPALDLKNKLRGSIGTALLITIIGLIALGAVVWWSALRSRNAEAAQIGAQEVAERQALLDKSPSTLQAVNLAKQGRQLIFPPLDPGRLQAALILFERAIELDADYFGGYAGSAQVYGMQATLSPTGDARDALLVTANLKAERAVALRPDASWSQSAYAWVAFANGAYDQANAISARAVAVNPKDFDTLDFDGLIALFSGEFERAIQSAGPSRHKDRTGSRFTYRNIYAAASFHLGQYDDTIKFFNDAAEQGDPVSQISVAYLAAAHYMQGNKIQAEKLVEDFEHSWPNERIDMVLVRIFSDQRFADEVIVPFKLAGWSP